MPFGDDEIVIQPLCGKDADGRWTHDLRILIHGTALQRLGLHPDQLAGEN
jgi:hypothetical protein